MRHELIFLIITGFLYSHTDCGHHSLTRSRDRKQRSQDRISNLKNGLVHQRKKKKDGHVSASFSRLKAGVLDRGDPTDPLEFDRDPGTNLRQNIGEQTGNPYIIKHRPSSRKSNPGDKKWILSKKQGMGISKQPPDLTRWHSSRVRKVVRRHARDVNGRRRSSRLRSVVRRHARNGKGRRGSSRLRMVVRRHARDVNGRGLTLGEIRQLLLTSDSVLQSRLKQVSRRSGNYGVMIDPKKELKDKLIDLEMGLDGASHREIAKAKVPSSGKAAILDQTMRWTEWFPWSTCSIRCANKRREQSTRSRVCVNKAGRTVPGCVGEGEQARKCVANRTCRLNLGQKMDVNGKSREEIEEAQHKSDESMITWGIVSLVLITLLLTFLILIRCSRMYTNFICYIAPLIET